MEAPNASSFDTTVCCHFPTPASAAVPPVVKPVKNLPAADVFAKIEQLPDATVGIEYKKILDPGTVPWRKPSCVLVGNYPSWLKLDCANSTFNFDGKEPLPVMTATEYDFAVVVIDGATGVSYKYRTALIERPAVEHIVMGSKTANTAPDVTQPSDTVVTPLVLAVDTRRFDPLPSRLARDPGDFQDNDAGAFLSSCATTIPKAGEPTVSQERNALQALLTASSDCDNDKVAAGTCASDLARLQKQAENVSIQMKVCAEDSRSDQSTEQDTNVKSWYKQRASLWDALDKDMTEHQAVVKTGKYNLSSSNVLSALENPSSQASKNSSADTTDTTDFNFGLLRTYFLGGALLSQANW